jgi:hypothetical protein
MSVALHASLQISLRSPDLLNLLTVGVEVVYFHFITFKTHTTVGRTPLDEGSARRRELLRDNTNTHKRQTSMGFEPTIPASAGPQTYALDRAATGMGIPPNLNIKSPTYCSRLNPNIKVQPQIQQPRKFFPLLHPQSRFSITVPYSLPNVVSCLQLSFIRRTNEQETSAP